MRGLWRLGLGVADSAVPSAGNLAVSVLAAHSMSLTDFGVFSTLLLSLLMIVGLSRSLHGDVLVLTAARDADEAAERTRRSLSSVLLCGAVVGLLSIAAGVVTVLWGADASPWGPALIASGMVLPVLLLQDHHRWIAYSRGSIQDSVVNNIVWVLCSIAATAAVALTAETQVTAAAGVLAWGLAAVGGLAVATLRDHFLPSLQHSTTWLRDNRSLAGALAQDFGLLQASAQGALILLAALTSAADIGLLRKAQLWLGPVTMVTTGLLSVLQSMLVRRHDPTRPRTSAKTAVVIGMITATGALVYGCVVFLLPSTWAAALTGDGWANARSFVWPLTVQLAAGLLGGCVGIALRVRGQVAQQVRARWVLAPASLVLVALTASAGGALAAAWSLAAVSVMTAGLWCYLLSRPTPTVVRSADSIGTSRGL